MPRHLRRLRDLPPGDLSRILRLAEQMKADPDEFSSVAHGRGLLLLFEKTSTRTALSYSAAIHRLGGYSTTLDWAKSNFSITPVEHEIRYASRNCDLIMARVLRHETLVTMARHSAVPVVNGCDDRYHPSQALADFLTIRERTPDPSTASLCYIGVRNNVSNCLVEGALELGIPLRLVTPLSNPASVDEELDEMARNSGLVEWFDDPRAAVAKSEFVYTDTWVDMEKFTDQHAEAKNRSRIELMMGYQLNTELLDGLDVRIMHDMPIHPGYEITEEVINDPRSIIFDQAENRMYAQQALIAYLLRDGDLHDWE